MAAPLQVLMTVNAAPGGGGGTSTGKPRLTHLLPGWQNIGGMTFHCAGLGGEGRPWERDFICGIAQQAGIR